MPVSSYPVSHPSPPMLVAESESIGAYEAKTHLPRLLEEVAQGKSFVITKHGRPVARLVAPAPMPEATRVIEALLAFRRSRCLGENDLGALRREGQR